VEDTILQAWDFNWRALLAHPAAFEAFLYAAVALRTYVYEKEVITWAMTSLHSACLALISIHGMSDHKWKRCSDEIKKALPAATFPTVAELRHEGPLMKGFLIKTTGQFGDFLICGLRQADPFQFPYLSNTYCRAVMGGLVAIDVIADTRRRVFYPQFCEYMVAHFKTKAIAVYRALDLVLSWALRTKSIGQFRGVVCRVFTSPGPDPWAEIHDGAQEEDRANPPAPD
jgi:hypothetical protein